MKKTHPVDTLAKKIGKDWPHIVNARNMTTATVKRIDGVLHKPGDEGVPLVSKDEVSIVAFGSLARQEFTQGSDLDWTMLIDGQVDPDHLELKKMVGKQLESEKFRDPGQEGTFGELVFSHDLVHQIGGDEDTNRNTTRRCLMLLESIPLGGKLAYSSVITAILKRYLIEDPSFMKKTGPYVVPRFLLNDFARYWRTMAVDFAYKRRRRFGEGAALRVIKLRISRKMLFASGLLSCFACQLNISRQEDSCPRTRNSNECIQCLGSFLRKTPQEIVALYLLRFLECGSSEKKEKSISVASEIFDTYNEFLGILEDKEIRNHLDSLQLENFEQDEEFRKGRELSRTFNEGILSLFFDLNDDLYNLTKFYGVF